MGNLKRRVPNKLRRYRCLMRFKQNEVVHLLGLKATYRISRWEKGERMPSAEHLLMMSVLYQTLPNQLYPDLIQNMKAVLDEKLRKMNRGNKGKSV